MTERDRLAIRRGYPPEAHRVLCVDYDGTLYPFGFIDEEPAPLPGAPEAMRRLHDHGFRLVIFTSRLSPSWLASAGYTADEMREKVERSLRRDGIPFDGITGEKVAAEAYIDDRAIRFDGDWPPIVDWLLWSGGRNEPA
jgi:hypothetical protein